MSSATLKKIIPCKKDQLVEMVLDIDKYPEFVPWCLGGKVHSRKESIDLVEIKADLKVGKRIINETYTSLVHYYKEKDKILVTNIDDDHLDFYGNYQRLLDAFTHVIKNTKNNVVLNIEDSELRKLEKYANLTYSKNYNSYLKIISKNQFCIGLDGFFDAGKI